MHIYKRNAETGRAVARLPSLHFRIDAKDYARVHAIAEKLGTTAPLAARRLVMMGVRATEGEQVPTRELVASLHADMEDFRTLLEAAHGAVESVRNEVKKELKENEQLLLSLLSAVINVVSIARISLSRMNADGKKWLELADADTAATLKAMLPAASLHTAGRTARSPQ